MQVVAALAAAVAVFAPQEPIRVSLLPPIVDGELDPSRRETLTRRVAAGLSRTGLDVDASSLGLPAGERCEDKACRQRVASSLQARYLVFAEIGATLRDYEFSFTLVDGESGESIGQISDVCSPCGFEEASELAAQLAGQVRLKLDQRLSAPARIRIETDPVGAAVSIDGDPVGAAPVNVEVKPGEHVARAHLDRFSPGRLRFAATAGVAETLRIELHQLPVDQRKSKRRRAAGWSMVAVGTALAVAGAVLIAIDSRPVRGRCDGSDVDAQGNCRNLYNTLGYGIGGLVGGVGVLGGGIGLLARRRR